ncbi:methyltransferase [Steroidobacter agaridevorans]|uniref:Methyltransferase n=1 Tax=Steroidobacter agaridevorans TaxID=2695856 RepID=A0A829YPF1_9GAMM|nr:class I SAM-dependent methyltransferase [Steroidobacter agaridevorans]GFE84366.1 methyltransferase [Steroidobacter agaridevorans]
MQLISRCLLPLALSLFVWGHAAVADDSIAAAIASARMPADRVEDSWRKPHEVLQFLEIAPGQHVLDFYAGPGYYSELLAHIVGPTGQVLIYNNELYNQAAHNGLTSRLARKRLPNAIRVNAPSNYLKLAPASLDRVLIVLTYHDIYWQPGDSPEPMGDPDKVLRILRDALKPGGLVVVVDHVANPTARENITPVANRLHRIDPQVVRADFARAGFAFVDESNVLRQADDDHTKSVFDASIRHSTDQFIYKFLRP